MKRSNFFQLKNGTKALLPFTDNEYENRLNNLRNIIKQEGQICGKGIVGSVSVYGYKFR